MPEMTAAIYRNAPHEKERRVLLRGHLGVDFTSLENHVAHGGFSRWNPQ